MTSALKDTHRDLKDRTVRSKLLESDGQGVSPWGEASLQREEGNVFWD